MKKTKIIQVRVTEEVKKAILSAATKYGMKEGEFIRFLIGKEIMK